MFHSCSRAGRTGCLTEESMVMWGECWAEICKTVQGKHSGWLMTSMNKSRWSGNFQAYYFYYYFIIVIFFLLCCGEKKSEVQEASQEIISLTSISAHSLFRVDNSNPNVLFFPKQTQLTLKLETRHHIFICIWSSPESGVLGNRSLFHQTIISEKIFSCACAMYF